MMCLNVAVRGPFIQIETNASQRPIAVIHIPLRMLADQLDPASQGRHGDLPGEIASMPAALMRAATSTGSKAFLRTRKHAH